MSRTVLRHGNEMNVLLDRRWSDQRRSRDSGSNVLCTTGSEIGRSGIKDTKLQHSDEWRECCYLKFGAAVVWLAA